MRRLIGVLVVIALVTCLAPVGSARTGGPAPAGQKSEGSITPFLTLHAIHDVAPYSAPCEDVRLRP